MEGLTAAAAGSGHSPAFSLASFAAMAAATGNSDNNNGQAPVGGSAAATTTAAATAALAKTFLERFNSSFALSPPRQVELRKGGAAAPDSPSALLGDGGVWALEEVSAGVRYGPFMGKWTPEPADPRFAWEVSARKRICHTIA